MDRSKPIKSAKPSIKLDDINFTPILIALLVVLVTVGKIYKKNK